MSALALVPGSPSEPFRFAVRADGVTQSFTCSQAAASVVASSLREGNDFTVFEAAEASPDQAWLKCHPIHWLIGAGTHPPLAIGPRAATALRMSLESALKIK